MKIKITCKRWFQKSYGNTYHSVLIKFLEPKKDDYSNSDYYIPYTYGYENQCLETARRQLEKMGRIPKTTESVWSIFKRFDIEYIIEDVKRKKDL